MPSRASNNRSETFSALRQGNYRRYFIGQVISQSGSWVQTIALGWLVLEETGSAADLGWILALQYLPVLVFGPYGGLVADRFDKRRALLVTQTSLALIGVVLWLVASTRTGGLAWIGGCAAASGFVSILDSPARQAFLLEMVDSRDVRNAVSLNSVLANVSRVIGPAIGGLLIGTVGLDSCFLINAASFVAAIISLQTMNVSRLTPVAAAVRAPRQLRDGFSYVLDSPALYLPLLMMTLIGTFTYQFPVLLPVLARTSFHSGASSYGYLTSSMGIGAALGGLVNARSGGTGALRISVAAVCLGVSTLVLSTTTDLVAAMVTLAFVGASSVLFIATANSTVQLASTPAMRGRVMGFWAVATVGTIPVGGPLTGSIAQHFGVHPALAVAGACALATGVLGFAGLSRPALAE